MTQRSPDDLRHELQALDQAHAQNEAARDSFVALAHTALFAASVSFVGSAVPLAKAVWSDALIAGWALDVVGLLSLTVSFVTARKAIDARRAALYVETAPIAVWSDRLNGIALWSFPAALLCLFSFVAANVIHINDQSAKLTTATATSPIERIQGHIASSASAASARRSVTAANGRGAGSKSAGCATTCCTSCSGAHEKVSLQVSRQGSPKTHLAGPVASDDRGCRGDGRPMKD